MAQIRESFGFYRGRLLEIDQIIQNLSVDYEHKVTDLRTNYQNWLKNNRMVQKPFRNCRRRPSAPNAPYFPEFVRS